ncbi:MAG: CotH kinase family protein [Oscillospiraceae bacterium]|nr:CotH kinase family protein [Oscillospiraceae bacterium]
MKFKKIIYIILTAAFLVSCNINPGIEDNGVIVMDIIETEDMRLGLYPRVAGLSGLKVKTARTDPFDLQFSHKNYFYTENIYVSITGAIEEAVIYYTTNGSEPQKGLISQHNRKYTGEPVLIKTADANSPTVLKAAAFLTDGTKSGTLTHTYFVSPAINSRFDENLYIFSVSSDPYNLYDYDYGILVEGRLRGEWLAGGSGSELIPSDPANYNLRGRESERPAYIEVLNSKGELLISQSAGIRVRGGWSRSAAVKSIGLYARGEYDPIFDKFYYDFFRFFDFNGKTAVRGTDIPVEAYSMLVLRNGGNDRNGAHMREELSGVLAKKAGFPDFKETAPAAMFINGEYHGFFWLQTWFSECYMFDNYGETAKSSIDIKYWWEMPDGQGVSCDETLEAFLQTVCIDNLMRYYAFQTYINNRDWPHNNLKIWRYGGEGGEYINKYYDGKYRFLPFDLELAWGIYEMGYKDRIIGRAKSGSPVFDNLMQRGDMIEKFCNQLRDFINSVFTFESVLDAYGRIIDLCDGEIRTAIGYNVSGTNRQQLEKERAAILEFARNRAEYVIDDMRLSFDLEGGSYEVTVIGKPGADIKLNSLEAAGAAVIYGSYFTEHSVILSAETHSFDHWLICGRRYETPELLLNSKIAQNGNITAELFLK